MPERFVLDRRDTDRSSSGSLDNFYCFETLFFRMCEAALKCEREKEIVEALPRPRLLLEAVLLSDGCVQGLKRIGVRLDDHDYKTTRAEVRARMKAIERNCEHDLDMGTLEVALDRLDEWRESPLVSPYCFALMSGGQ